MKNNSILLLVIISILLSTCGSPVGTPYKIVFSTATLLPPTATVMPTARPAQFSLQTVAIYHEVVVVKYENADPDTCPGLFEIGGNRLIGDYLCGDDKNKQVEVDWETIDFPTMRVGMHVRLCIENVCSNAVEVTGEELPTPVPLSPGYLIGQSALDFSLERLDGKGMLTLSSLRGKMVVVNYYATWCGYCAEEMPDFIQAAMDHPDVQFVFIDENETLDAIQTFWAQFAALPFNAYSVRDSYHKYEEAYLVRFRPDTVIISGSGEILFRYTGEVWPGWQSQLKP